jgi:hypothetical protein
MGMLPDGFRHPIPVPRCGGLIDHGEHAIVGLSAIREKGPPRRGIRMARKYPGLTAIMLFLCDTLGSTGWPSTLPATQLHDRMVRFQDHRRHQGEVEAHENSEGVQAPSSHAPAMGRYQPAS